MMSRPEKDLDPSAGPLSRFACDLRALRRGVPGLTYRVMANRANYSATVLSEAAAGRRLPSLEVTRAYVEACGGDWARWAARWQDVSGELAGPVCAELDATAAEPADSAAAPAAHRTFGRHRWLIAGLTGAVMVLVVGVLALLGVLFADRSTGQAAGARSPEGPWPRGTPTGAVPPPAAVCSQLPVARGCFDSAAGVFWVKDLPPGDGDHAAVYWAAADGTARGECHNVLSSKGPWVTCPLSGPPTTLTLRVAVVDGTTVRQRGPEVTVHPG